MRLGQLARKISVRQADMVDFLAKSGVVISNESNTRLEDEYVHILLEHFAPSFLDQNIEETEPMVQEIIVPEAVALPVHPVEIESVSESIPSKIEAPVTEELQEEKIELIKAPKVDLPGLKVIGKIELPVPKKKETPTVIEGEKAEASAADLKPNNKPRTQRSGRNAQDNNRRERSNRPTINPIALQREREAQAAEEKRKAAKIKEKENKTEYYLNRVKANAPTKPARIYSDPVEHYTSATKKEEPKTLLGKFLRWLTT